MNSAVCFPVDESSAPTCPSAACYRCSVAHTTNKFIRATDRELVHMSIAKMLVPALRQLCCTFPGQYDETWIDNAPSDWDRTTNVHFYRACLYIEEPGANLSYARSNTDWAIKTALQHDETHLLQPQRRLQAQALEMYEGCSEMKQITMYPLARLLHRRTYTSPNEMERAF